jgi:alcohol dehydrogenase
MNMCSVISNKALGEKSYIWAECIFPAVAILDPQLTTSLPAFQSACAAADTISHVLEIYINSREDTPLQNYFQEGCMRTTIENIAAALETPDDLEARGNLMWASTCAINGWSWPGAGWTPMHQVGHVLTSRHGVNHGSSLSVIMPHWMRYNKSRRLGTYKTFAVRVMDVDPAGKTDEQIADEGIDRFEAFLAKIGVPTKLSDVGITEANLQPILDGAVKVSFGADGNLNCNPVMTQDDVMNVLKAAL